MKKRMLKSVLMCSLLLVCATSFAHAQECVQCTIDPSSYDWVQADPSTWHSNIYQLKINCVDTCNSNQPAVNHVAQYTATLNKGTYPYTPITNLSLSSTPTDSNGDAYVTVPLIHEPKDGGGYIHLCPFDDVNCTGGGPSPSHASPANSSANSSEIAPLTSSIVTPGSGCYGLIGCCQVTINVFCCPNPPRTFTYCTYNTQFNCLAQDGWPDPCTQIIATWNPTGVCNYCTGICVPNTAITLSSFTAKPGNGSVTLNWATETEIDNAGFNILRAETENGEYVKINGAIIPAKAGATQGASYQFIDGNAKNRKTYYYKLEDIDLNGNATQHGPKSAAPKWIYDFWK